ncbi:uncharacterized protein LOC109409684 isoform X13 [Aedes albopictus]|uniref:FYVE-type zinc finger domain-containing protein n=1 Tax=Aedes albopictus TaxID=7160 RepID=A0ABM1YBK4_AEDAL
MQIELAEFSQKLQEYRAILERLQSEKQSYQQRRERLSKLSQRRRSEIRKPDVVCYMCNANIEVEDTNSFATCRGCERLVCRSEEKQCCEWIPAIGIWECRNCHSSRVIQQKAGEWLLNQLTSRLQNPGPVNLNSEGLLGLTDSDDARSCTSSISSNQKVKVREFIEELLSSLLNGPLDDVSVGQLMENESYSKVFHRYHSRLGRCLYNLELSIHQSLSDLPLIEGQTEPSSPSDTHFELRKMLQKILDEVAKLPGLLNHSGFPLRPEEHLPYFSPKKYEQLLATAVLNKVVEDYRNPKNFEHVKPEADTAGPPTTGATSAGSAPATTGTTFDINHNKVPGESLLNEANLRKMSLDKELKEELYNRSLSESDESYLSDYIQKHTVPLPDLSDTTGSGPEDDVISLKSNTTDGTWEENWLFKKRQLKSTESSIAMLVPSPTEEVKALIGDKNADEVSDLSEAGSDVEEYDSDSNVKNTDTGSSPKKAGNSLDDHAQDSLISINSIASNEPVLSEAKNDLLLQEQTVAQELHNNMVNDLISIEPCSVKTEAANPTLIENKSNPFLSGPESVLIEENNNIVKLDEVETDDIKLMQERIQNTPKQCDVDGNVMYPIGIARTIPVDGHSSECDRKEVPIDRGTPEALDESDNELLKSSDGLPSQSGSSSPTDTSTEAVAGSVDRVSSPEDFYPTPRVSSNDPMTRASALDDQSQPTPIAIVTQQMRQYCEELKGILYPRETPQPTSETSGEQPQQSSEIPEALLLFQEELRAANEDPSQSVVKPCKDHPIQTIAVDSYKMPASETLTTPLEQFAALSAIYNQSLRDMDHEKETAPEAEDTSCSLKDTNEIVLGTPSTEESVLSEAIITADENDPQPKAESCEDQLVQANSTESSSAPKSESLPTPMEDFAIRSDLYNLTLRKIDNVDENIPVAVTEASPAIPEMCDHPEALQFQEELRVANDDPTQAEVKPCKDHPIQSITSGGSDTPVSESLPTPMEEFAVKSANYNHSLRRIDYVEESTPVAEDASCLHMENHELSITNAIVTVTPSAEEHAVQEAIIIEHTPTPEPIAAVEVSYERQVTATVEELKDDRKQNQDILESIVARSSSTPIELEQSSLAEEKSQCDPVLSSADPECSPKEKDTPTDLELASLTVPHSAVCVLTNTGDTNLTNAAESDVTNTTHANQPPSFTSEATITIVEPDSYHCPQIAAQSEAVEKQKPSETSNGHVPAVATNGDSKDDSAEDEMLIPGSIAEREHLKWRNASPIANNPYSPDVLQKRLEESNRKSSLFDFDRLAGKDPTSPTLEVPDDSDLLVDSKEEEDTAEQDRSLQSVLGANPNQYQRYGRDYYINDAKRACGSRKQTPDLPTQLTHSTDDEKSLLLSQKQDQPISLKPCHQNNDQQPAPGAFPCVKSSSCGSVANKQQSEDIFSAGRPVEVTRDDDILKKGTKVECLSTPAREIYLVPADEPITPHSLGSSSELSMASRADDSLTFSEDSDVTRIYEIGTGESKVIHGDVIGGEKDTGQTPPSTPTYGDQLINTAHPIDEEQTMNKLNTLKQQESELLSEEILEIIPQVRALTPTQPEQIPEEPSSPTIDRSHLLKPHLLKNKPLSPETIKFFSPKKPFSTNLAASSSLSQSTSEIRELPLLPISHYHSSLHIDYPPTRPAPAHHDFIIEKEVMEVLPSVKELAKCYSGSQQDVNAVPKPLHKPRVKLRKDFIRQSSDMLNEEQPQETRSGMPQVDNKNRRMYCSTSSITAAEDGRRANVEAYNPPSFVPMAPGHSITARSLSKQIRDELKINATDDHKVQGGHTSPERPSSPVFAPGHLRSSIQFFESLRDKQ